MQTEVVARKNIRLLYVIRVLRSTLIAIPVIVLFYKQIGLSQTEIFMLQGIFAISMIICEMPSGYFADVKSRKLSIVLGSLCSMFGFVVYTFSYGFMSLAVAEVLLGIGLSFISGADSAMAYESLLVEDASASYRTFEARSTAFAGISEALASVLGGIIALVSLRATIAAQVLVEALIVVLALMLTEPPHATSRRKASLRDIAAITKFALHEHTELKWLMLYGALIGTLTHTMVWITQPYYLSIGVGVGWYGVLWAAQLGFMAVSAQFAHRFEQQVGRRAFMASLLVLGVGAYVLLGAVSSVFMLPVILAFYFIRGVQMPIMRDYVNGLIESDVRATVLSTMSLLQRVLYVAIGPVIGLVTDRSGLSAALVFSGAVYGLLGAFVVLRAVRLKVV